MKIIETIQKEHGPEAALAFKAMARAYYELRNHHYSDTPEDVWNKAQDAVGGSCISYANDRIDDWIR